VTRLLTVPDMMMLVGGQWQPLERIRTPVATHIRRAIALEDSSLTEAERRTRFASRTAQAMVTAVADNRELYILLGTRQRPGVNAFAQLESFINYFTTQLVDIFLDDSNQFVQRLRVAVVRCVGMLLEHSQSNVFRTPHDLNAVVQTVVRIIMTQAQGAGGGAGWQQQLQALGPMAGNLAMNALGQWLGEYNARHRRDTDGEHFTSEVRRFPPLTTAASATPNNNATSSAAVDLDAMLDEAIDGPTAAGSNSDTSFEAEVRSALERNGLSTAGAEEVTRGLQRGVPESNNNTAEQSEQFRQLLD